MKSATSFSTPISRVPIIPHTAETKTVHPVVVLRKIHEITINFIKACANCQTRAGFYEGVLVAFPLIFLSIRVFPIVDVMIQEFSRDINLYIEFSSINQVGEIINHLKAQDVQIYEVDIERGREKQSRNPSAFFSVRMNQKQTHSQLLSNLAGLDGICVIEEI